MNMPNLLHMYLGIAPEGPVQARAQMDRARAAGFTHARFIASGYWPADMTRANGWRTNATAYWQAVDQLMADARARQLRLVPSLLWNAWLFPDLNNQPLNAMFTPGSATRTMADQYVREFVQRYANEPAVAVWEIGNEWNLLADLDFSTCTVCAGSAMNNCGSLAPSLGTACSRSAADTVYSCNSCRGVSTTTQDLGQWAQSMAQLIKQHDTLQRPVSTGHAYPRPSAWHLARSPCPSCNWTVDSETEFTQTLGQLHPSPIDFISVHAYPGDDAKRFGDTDATGFTLLQRTQTAATSLGKRLYVGEYGEPRAGSITCNGTEACNGDANSASTKLMALGLVQFDVALSALWAFDFHQFCAATPTCYGVEANTPLASFLSTAERAALQCRGQPDGLACATGRCSAGTWGPSSTAPSTSSSLAVRRHGSTGRTARPVRRPRSRASPSVPASPCACRPTTCPAPACASTPEATRSLLPSRSRAGTARWCCAQKSEPPQPRTSSSSAPMARTPRCSPATCSCLLGPPRRARSCSPFPRP